MDPRDLRLDDLVVMEDVGRRTWTKFRMHLSLSFDSWPGCAWISNLRPRTEGSKLVRASRGRRYMFAIGAARAAECEVYCGRTRINCIY